MTPGPATLLRADALAGRHVVVAPVAGTLGPALEGLGASVASVATGDPGPARALVVDTRAVLDAARAAAPGDDGLALRTTLDDTWAHVHAVATAALIPAGVGTIALVAPAPGAFVHARAVRAGVENLARSLSTEWARHAVTTVAVLPGDATPHEVVDALCAYLVSPAGDYFSGCALELDALAASTPSV